MSVLKDRYEVVESLFRQGNTEVFRARRRSDGKMVVIKSLHPHMRNERSLRQFANELEILSSLKSSRVSQLIDVWDVPPEYSHIFDDIGGESLHNLMQSVKLTLAEKLEITVKLAEALADIHTNRLIHGDLNPRNVVYNRLTKELQVIDFGCTVSEPDRQLKRDMPIFISGNILYMAPEQTGRTDQVFDYRSDFYSFGITLYHLFSGKLPFKASDKHALIHKHIAEYPQPLETLDLTIPKAVSDMVSKLIQKNPNNRYQSDEAILHDVNAMVSQLALSGKIEPFPLGSVDSKTISVGENIVGRAAELETLQSVFKQAKSGMRTRVVISGSSGIGKTRLVEEYLSYFEGSAFWMIQGKFGQYKTDFPYVAFKQIVAQICRKKGSQLLQKTHYRFEADTLVTLGEVFPEITQLFKNFPPSKGIDPETIRKKFPYAMYDFFNVLATAKNPLILFIDDLQWCDEASGELLLNRLWPSENPHFHLVLSYRENDSAALANKELFQKIVSSKEEGGSVIRLHPLGLSDIEEILCPVVGKGCHELGAIVHAKTGGNPFFIKTFLQYLNDSGMLNQGKEGIVYNIDTIRHSSALTDISGLIKDKTEALAKVEIAYLQYLALLGDRFGLKMAVEMMESFGFAEPLFYRLIHEGFLEVTGESYRFAHDQILHHVYTTISPDQMRLIHSKIGKFLKKRYEEGQYGDIITLVYHLNRAHTDRTFSVSLFEFNVAGLNELIVNNSYALALNQVRWIDANLDGEKGWHSHRALVFEYELIKAKILYKNGNFVESDALVQMLFAKTRGIEERLQCFALLKDVRVTMGEGFGELIGIGQDLLKELGIEHCDEDSGLLSRIEQLNRKIERHTCFNDPESILELKPMSSLKRQRIVSLLADYWEVAYYLSDIDKMQWSFLEIVETSLRYGNSSVSSFGYVLYASSLVSRHEYAKGRAFGETALRLTHQFNDASMVPKVYNFMANFVNPFNRPLQENLPLYQKSLVQSKHNGDIVFGTWANFLLHYADYLSGKSLDKLYTRMLDEQDFLLQSGDEKMIAIYRILKKSVASMMGVMVTTVSDELDAGAVALWERERFYPGLAWYALIKAIECLMERRVDDGLDYLRRYVHSDANEVIMFPVIMLRFIRALLLLSKGKIRTRAENILLDEELKRFEAYFQGSPKTFRFMNLLLKAESMMQGNYWNVAKMYDKAMIEARKQKTPLYVAIAGICAAGFWEKLQYDHMKERYLDEAVAGLRQWGAHHLAQTIKRIYIPQSSALQKNSDLMSNAYLTQESSGFKTLMKSFYAISQAVETHRVIKILMDAILENATASKAVLLLKEKEHLYIRAALDFTTKEIEFSNTLMSHSDILPVSMVSEALEIPRVMVVEHPDETDAYGFDEYFHHYQPASSIVIPAMVDGKVEGGLYLENRELVTPLDSKTMLTLKLLLTQAGINFKNAKLIEDLQHSQQILTKAQSISNLGSWEYSSIDDSIKWSAQTYRIFELEPYSIEIDNDWFNKHLYPNDRKIIKEAISKALKKERYYDVEHRIITAKGNTRFVHQRAEVVGDAHEFMMYGMIQDITEKHDSEELINRLSQVVSQNPFCTLITDTKGVIQFVNAQGEEMTGYSSEELIGKHVNIFRSSVHSADFYREIWDTVYQKQQIWKGTIVNTIKSGETRDIASTIFPIFDSNDKVVNFASIQEDVTERNIQNKIFLMQTRQAQMGEMLSMIAHQWRQPLTIIASLLNRERVNILMQTASMDDIIESFDSIEVQIDHLSQTITDFRDFFKPDKEAVLTRTSTIVTKTLNLIIHSLSMHGIAVIQSHQHDDEYYTFESELVQVMLNLFKNAQDAFEGKNIESPHIRVSSDRREGRVLMIVEDNAGGIDPRVMDTLFLPYVSTKPQQTGTGLGLYMCKTVVENHCKGSIKVENTPLGARFIIEIPIFSHLN